MIKTTTKKLIKTILINAVIWALALLWVLPFIGLALVSLMPYREVIVRGWLRLPSLDSLSFKNFIEALANPLYDMATGYRNSVIVASASTILPLISAALAAYAFTYLDFRLKAMLFGLIIVLMMVPQQLVVVPLFFLYNYLRLYNTIPGIVLLHSAWGVAWSTFFLRNYFKFIPKSLVDAARVFGASDFQIFRKIVIPLSIPGIIAATVLQFTWVWNDLFYALTFLVSKENQVLTQKLVMLKGEYHIDWGLLTAGSIITMSMPLILYIAFNKYFMRGVAGWGVRR